MMRVYVGTYAEQIQVFELDNVRGTLSPVQTVAAERNPSYLALGPGGRTLYAVNEQVDQPGVSAFVVDPASGRLTFVNRVAAHGADPAHLSVEPGGRWLLVANYTGGTIAVMPIRSDGGLDEASHVVRHTGSGPNQRRQEGPHPHMIVPDPDGGFVLVPDLGADRVFAYRLESTSGQLSAQADGGAQLPPGSGPRHLAFAPGARTVYVINELASTLAAFDYDWRIGELTLQQTVSTLPESVTVSSTTAAVVVAPTGRFVYGSNRGHDSVATFAIDASTGQLTPLGHTPTGGRTPRDINLDPSGRYLISANQGSDTLTMFEVDQDTGQLTPTISVDVPKPSRVLFGRE